MAASQLVTSSAEALRHGAKDNDLDDVISRIADNKNLSDTDRAAVCRSQCERSLLFSVLPTSPNLGP